jgi:Spy/CpxP family protein refolding chaperone
MNLGLGMGVKQDDETDSLYEEMDMKKKLYLGVVLVLILALVTTVFAFGPRVHNGGRPPGSPDFWDHPGPGFGGPPMSGEGPEGQDRLRGGPGVAFPGGISPIQLLDLSKEQLSKMRELANRTFQEIRGPRYEVLQKGLEMRMLFTDPKVDEATLLAKQKELSSLRQKLMNRMAQMMIEGRRILTPEQIQKLDRIPMGHGGMDFEMMGPNLFGPP